MSVIWFNSKNDSNHVIRSKPEYTPLFRFEHDGNAYNHAFFFPHWDGIMAIWRIMETRYLPPFIPDYIKGKPWYTPGMSVKAIYKASGRGFSRLDPGHGDAATAVFALADDPRIPEVERIVLYTTFEDILVRNENIPRVVDAFRQFDGKTSLAQQANCLERLYEKGNAIAVGWGFSTEGANNWDVRGGYDPVSECGIRYNCLTMYEHRWLFDTLGNTL